MPSMTLLEAILGSTFIFLFSHFFIYLLIYLFIYLFPFFMSISTQLILTLWNKEISVAFSSVVFFFFFIFSSKHFWLFMASVSRFSLFRMFSEYLFKYLRHILESFYCEGPGVPWVKWVWLQDNELQYFEPVMLILFIWPAAAAAVWSYSYSDPSLPFLRFCLMLDWIVSWWWIFKNFLVTLLSLMLEPQGLIQDLK